MTHKDTAELRFIWTDWQTYTQTYTHKVKQYDYWNMLHGKTRDSATNSAKDSVGDFDNDSNNNNLRLI